MEIALPPPQRGYSINQPSHKADGRIGSDFIPPIMVLVLDIFKDIRTTPLIFPSKQASDVSHISIAVRGGKRNIDELVEMF